uniref:Uncharacterized protein n=1 Tax=Romanomermis culicivorax TaxID=13658 RepID=A0A915KRG5_ROMCU
MGDFKILAAKFIKFSKLQYLDNRVFRSHRTKFKHVEDSFRVEILHKMERISASSSKRNVIKKFSIENLIHKIQGFGGKVRQS